MKKTFSLLLVVAACGASAGEFAEKFVGKSLSPQDWMVTYAAQCAGIDYRKPLQGKLVIAGLKKIRGKEAVAFLDRDANFTAGDFRLTVGLEAAPAPTGAGVWRFQLLTENGELLLGAALKSDGGRITVAGQCGHSCKTLKDRPIPGGALRGVLEIVRKKGLYQVLFQGKSVYEGDGDTAAAASFRLQVSGAPGVLTLTELSLRNLR